MSSLGTPTSAPTPEKTVRPGPNYTHITTDQTQMHLLRRQAMRKKYPQLQELEKPRPWTIFFVPLIIGIQLGLAYFIKANDLSWSGITALAFCIGAIVDHADWVLMHDFSHNLVFKSDALTYAGEIFCNLPLIAPAGISFLYFHREHHGHLNEAYADPDLPGPLEDRIFGYSALGKALWLFCFAGVQTIRSLRYRPRWGILLKWNIANWVVQMSFNIAVVYYLEYKAFGYLVLSTLFAIGLHPLGARWVAEHYSIAPLQETYSYYGSFNRLGLNIGYHVEHHDLPNVPCWDLPKVRAIAHEFYDDLVSHDSYWKLLYRFIFDPNITLRTRVVRPSREKIALKYDLHGNQKVEHYEALLDSIEAKEKTTETECEVKNK
jgi:sphingolipid delta-4 desaturase